MSTLPIRFEFNKEKATAAVAVLLNECPAKTMPHSRLSRLLYAAERESLQRRGRPIVGDYYLSTKHGPALSTVLYLINAGAEDLDEKDPWKKHIRKDGGNVALLEDPGAGALSESEVDSLREISARYPHQETPVSQTFTGAYEALSTFPEWRGDTALPIHPEDILRAVGKTEEEIAEIAQEVEESNRLDALLRGETPA